MSDKKDASSAPYFWPARATARRAAGFSISALWIIKVGGSLAQSPDLRRWLRAIARFGAGRAIVVPGGGPFADEVRRAQRVWRFDDVVAHRMALLAMQQYGLMLCGVEAELQAAETEADLRTALQQGRAAVWLPWQMAAAANDIPMNWNVTSDSLAAWLANRVSASSLALVKSCPSPFAGVTAPAQVLSAATLRAAGIVDPAFPAFLPAGMALHVFAAHEHELLGDRMNATSSAVMK